MFVSHFWDLSRCTGCQGERVQARIDSAVRSASSRGSKGGAPTPTEPTFLMMALRVAVVLCSLSWATAQLSESVDCDQSFALQRCLFVVGWCHWGCTLGVHTYGHTLILSHTIKTIIAMFKAFALSARTRCMHERAHNEKCLNATCDKFICLSPFSP